MEIKLRRWGDSADDSFELVTGRTVGRLTAIVQTKGDELESKDQWLFIHLFTLSTRPPSVHPFIHPPIQHSADYVAATMLTEAQSVGKTGTVSRLHRADVLV